jgi:hypothetical protein
MDTSRMSQGQLIAGASAVLLFIFTFLPWFGAEGVDSQSIWKVPGSPFDIFLLIVVIVAIAATLTAASGGIALPGITLNGATAVLGIVASICILWLLIDFPEGADRKIGLFLSLLAAIGVGYGGWTAAQDEAVVRDEGFAPPADRTGDRYSDRPGDRY